MNRVHREWKKGIVQCTNVPYSRENEVGFPVSAFAIQYTTHKRKNSK